MCLCMCLCSCLLQSCLPSGDHSSIYLLGLLFYFVLTSSSESGGLCFMSVMLELARVKSDFWVSFSVYPRVFVVAILTLGEG